MRVGQVLSQRDGYQVVVTEANPDGSYKWRGGVRKEGEVIESQRIVLNWKARLKELGWPDEEISAMVTDLLRAGAFRCIDELKARAERDEALIQKAVAN